MKKNIYLSIVATLFSVVLSACGGAVTPTEEVNYADWDSVVAAADGQTVNWFMWGGADNINAWVNGPIAETLKADYNVTLNMVPINDTAEAVNKVLGEKEAGQDTEGSVDMVWINGENFRTMRQGDLLFGGWSESLPNYAFVDATDPSVLNDFGYPVEGYESPYGKAQFVMIYDTANVDAAPTTISDLVEWIKANPGKFTYPAAPDFIGSAFIRHVCYDATGGYEQFLGDFDQALFDEKFGACWDLLNEIEPFLWREGEYPESDARMKELLANGEVHFDMDYNPGSAGNLIEDGVYPDTVRTFVFETGTLANTHFVGIPYNSPNKAAAMVLANVLLSPDAQLQKADPAIWGDLPVLNPALLSEEDAAAFDALPRHPATLSTAELAAARLPELQAPWVEAIEQGWIENVLEQ